MNTALRALILSLLSFAVCAVIFAWFVAAFAAHDRWGAKGSLPIAALGGFLATWASFIIALTDNE